jgi:acyl carrier protein
MTLDTGFLDLLRPFLKYAGDKPISADSSLHELGLDSMRAIELLFAVEDRYGVAMPDEMLTDSTFATADSLWSTIAALRERTP